MLGVWRRLTIFVVGQAAIMVAIELWLLPASQGTSAPDPGLYRNPTPFVEFYQQPNYDGNGIHTNDAGFRYGDLSINKPADEIRIFFLSTSLGFNGKTNDSTIAGLMESALAAAAPAGKRIRVINASGVSFCSTQSLSLLVTRILDYSPDILIVFQGSEALFMPTEFEGRPGYPFNFALREDHRKNPISPAFAAQSVDRWLTSTRTMRRFHPNWLQTRLESRLSETDNRIAISSLDQYDPYISVLATDIRKIVRIAGGFNTKVLIAIPPCRHADILPGAIERMEDRLLAVLDETGDATTKYVDTLALETTLADASAWHSDGVHWSDQGNKIVADRLLKSLKDSKWLEDGAANMAEREPESHQRQAKGSTPYSTVKR